MRINELVYFIQDLMESTFLLLEALGNKANIFFILVIFVLMMGWIIQMGKFKSEAEQTGGIE